MPIKNASKKSLRQSLKRRQRNLATKDGVRQSIKLARRSIKEGNKDKAAELVKKAISTIDKAVTNKVLKKNTGARKKSRLVKYFNSLKT
ncbi:MAG: 30S ribosomal protein S20 [Patescibacteria group bacterium]|nr:30S ribosomal protein S20 [Patescibacteria group bacterium]